jgi:hypothetical protein
MTRDEIATLEQALRAAEPPDAGPARERARRTVLAAHAQARPRHRVRRAAPLVWAALAATLAALVVTQRDSGPAQAVERLVRDIVRAPAAPAPTPAAELALPTSGRLLVSGADGLYVVSRSRRTRLGSYEDAAWSPNGLYVIATTDRTLTALDPRKRRARWTVRPGTQVSLPRWSPGGLHIAYRAGGDLRIVWGNGRHDVLAGRDMAPVAPAWRPGTARAVAWAATDGTVTVEDADTAKVLWSHEGGPVRALAWSGDGRRLLIAGRRHGAVHDLTTGRATPLDLAPGDELLAAAYGGNRLALAVRTAAGTEIRVRGDVLRVDGRLDQLEWSPDGRWLLAAGEHWLLARATPHPRVASLTAEPRFGNAARTHGWIRPL